MKENKVIIKYEPFSWGYCRCGCREQLPNTRAAYYIARYIPGHFAAKFKTGSNNSRWNKVRDRFVFNSRNKNSQNIISNTYEYYRTSSPEHPCANSKGLVLNSRLVYEQYLKILFDEDIYVPKQYTIYHLNKNEKDNSLVNLVPLTREELARRIHLIDMSGRFCQRCHSSYTYIRKDNGRPMWHHIYEFAFLCHSCYKREQGKKRYRKHRNKIPIFLMQNEKEYQQQSGLGEMA
jgi:hypothetical protein